MGCTCHPVHPAPGVGIGGTSERFATGHRSMPLSTRNTNTQTRGTLHLSGGTHHSSKNDHQLSEHRNTSACPIYKEPATTPASGPRLTDANCDANSNNHRTSCGACEALHRNKHTCVPFLAVQCRDREHTGVAMQFTYS